MQPVINKVLCLTHKSLKTGHLSYLRSLLSSTPRRSTCSSSLITLNRPSVTSGLKISNRSFYHFAPVLWNSLPSHLPHTAHHSTSSPTSDSGKPELSTSVFLNKFKSHLFRISFPPQSVITWATLGRISPVLTLLGLFHFIVISYHLIFTSFTLALFSWIHFYKCLRISLSFICSTFVSTLNQLLFIRLFIHLISYHFIFQFIHLIYISLGAKS